jgi:hypothetical protein
MIDTTVTFPCGDLMLKGISTVPEGDGPFPGVVVCHPHPLYGGMMDNNVVYAVCKALERSSMATLRFNFRGVGGSEGRYDNGVGEQEDIAAALTYLSSTEKVDPERIGLCGYSFGAGVALDTAARDERVKALALVSPILSPPSPAESYARPKLLLWGSRDMAVPTSDFDRFTSQLPEPKEYHVVNEADHFWWGYETGMAEMVSGFFAGWLKAD